MLTKRQKVKGSEGAFTNPGRIQYKGERHHLNSNLGYLLASKASAKVLGRWLGMPGLNVKANCIKVFLHPIQSCLIE